MEKADRFFNFKLWNRIVWCIIAGSILFIFTSLFLLASTLDIWYIGFIPLAGIFILLDSYTFKIFGSYLINKDFLSFNGGGFFWKFLIRKKTYPWGTFHYLIFYDQKPENENHLLVFNKETGKCVLSVQKEDTEKFDELLSGIKDFNLLVEFRDIEDLDNENSSARRTK